MGYRAVAALLTVFAIGGCVSPRVTDPARTATEQLLVSTAVDLAVEQMDLAPLHNRRVVLDSANFDGVDKAYAVGAIADRLSRQGAKVTADKEDADVVAAIRAGALSIDRSDFLIGVPRMNLPTPFGATVQTPELAFLKKTRQEGIAKLALSARDANTGKHILSLGPLSGISYHNLWSVLGIPFHFTNIPEKDAGRWWWPVGN